MTCRDIEKNIFLYSELDAKERESTDRHLQSCAACARIFSRAGMTRSLRSHLAATPEIADEAAMTRRIMNTVHETQVTNRSILASILSGKGFIPLKYSMAVLSMFLVFHFIDEASDGTMIPVKSHHIAGPKTVLHTASFHQSIFITIKEKRVDEQTLSARIAGCLQRTNGDCANRKTFIRKTP